MKTMNTWLRTEELIAEETTIRIAQRMSDGSVRTFEVNPEAIIGAVELHVSYENSYPVGHLGGGPTGARATLGMNLRPEPGVPSDEAWMLRLFDRPAAPSEPGPCTDPNCTLQHEPATVDFMGQPAMNERARQHTATPRKRCEYCGTHDAGYIANHGDEDGDRDLCACCYGEPYDPAECRGQGPCSSCGDDFDPEAS